MFPSRDSRFASCEDVWKQGEGARLVNGGAQHVTLPHNRCCCFRSLWAQQTLQSSGDSGWKFAQVLMALGWFLGFKPARGVQDAQITYSKMELEQVKWCLQHEDGVSCRLPGRMTDVTKNCKCFFLGQREKLLLASPWQLSDVDLVPIGYLVLLATSHSCSRHFLLCTKEKSFSGFVFFGL